MPDISMCKGTGCPFKNNCYRFKAKPDKLFQSYFVTPPYDKKTKKCEYRWKIEKKKK